MEAKLVEVLFQDFDGTKREFGERNVYNVSRDQRLDDAPAGVVKTS